ncbi:hypothetical protein KTAU_07530 [Thermogemmatispora aurantia]|uniref:Uncharacterized protein n=1 Tax=Thermogemmatispora aurantia TaxID=2045279 RepID=A0A5J4K3A4_9CHLR|nr:hypothetical protein KTAU_07530 [Thermogemmatispora aurantia]
MPIGYLAQTKPNRWWQEPGSGSCHLAGEDLKDLKDIRLFTPLPSFRRKGTARWPLLPPQIVRRRMISSRSRT